MKTNIIKALRLVSNEQLAEIAMQMAEVHPGLFETALVRLLNVETVHKFTVPNSGQVVTLTSKQFNDLKASAFGGNKVGGIKLIREATAIGLKEAKDLWEDLESQKILDYKPENFRSTY